MTDLDLRVGKIHRGLGTIARWKDIVVLIPSDTRHDMLVEEVFSRLGADPSASSIVRMINQLVNTGELVSVGMLVEATGGPVAVNSGGVEIIVDGDTVLPAGQTQKEQVSASASRITMRAANLSKAAEPVEPFDLRRGVVPGGGITLQIASSTSAHRPADDFVPEQAPQPNAAPVVNSQEASVSPQNDAADRPSAPRPQPINTPDVAEPLFADLPDLGASPVGMAEAWNSNQGFEQSATAMPIPTPEPQLSASPVPSPSTQANPANVPAMLESPQQSAGMQVSFRSFMLHDLPASEVARLEPLPYANGSGDVDANGTEAVQSGAAPLVQGMMCSRGHFNNPNSANCMVCGLSMTHLTQRLVTAPRPTLGFIVFDDGATYGLDRSYIVGRDPKASDRPDMQRLVVQTNNETLSRTHARIELQDWNVVIIDEDSTNGSYVWDSGAQQWNQLEAGQPTNLRSGDTVALGRRTFVYEDVT